MAGSFNIWERDAARPTDRELLERAARAAGCQGLAWRNGSQCFYYDDPETGREEWNPLQSLDQAMRLAVTLGLQVDVHRQNALQAACVEVRGYVYRRLLVTEPATDNGKALEAAVCRAIVRAAVSMTTEGQA